MLHIRAIGAYLGVIVGLLSFYGCSSNADDSNAVASTVPNPLVTQATGGHGRSIGGMRFDVTQYEYQEREYFFEGTAETYPPSDQPAAAYRSRMIVWTPADPSRFNGTTVVEWAHVSDFGQFELTVDLNFQAPMLVNAGFAFVLVSAEEGGVCDRGPNGCTATSLQGADTARYASLNHPGDVYSFDIFNQALQAIKYPTGTAPLGEIDTRFVIAEGFQASIDKWFPVGHPNPPSITTPFSIYGALNAYLASGAADTARLADAFLIDGGAPAFEPSEYPAPTLHHLDESALRRTPTPDSPNHVTWEVIGAAHVDRWAGDHIQIASSGGPKPLLSREEEEIRRDAFDNFGQVSASGGQVCAPSSRTGSLFPRRFTLNAALVALHEWLETGVPAPTAPRAERVGPPPDVASEKLNRDGDGNAIGGLRSPIIQVPVASYNGESCIQAGTTTPLSPERLAEMYPTHHSYVEQLLATTNEAVHHGFLLCQDAETIMRKASASIIGGNDEFSASPGCAQQLDELDD